MEYQQADVTHELLDLIEKLEISVDISEAQNVFYTKVITKLPDMIANMSSQNDRNLIEQLFYIGERLNINVDFYRAKFDKALVTSKE